VETKTLPQRTLLMDLLGKQESAGVFVAMRIVLTHVLKSTRPAEKKKIRLYGQQEAPTALAGAKLFVPAARNEGKEG